MLSLDRYFQGYARMEMVVVHPAYWARGHGGDFIKWGTELARTDNVKQGVIATEAGVGLCERLGWKKLTESRIEGDEIVPEGVSAPVLEYDPN
jgi:N-acetylglutamate synthase-like GNAT family acetyltransferase